MSRVFVFCTDSNYSKMLRRIHEMLFHPEFAPNNPKLWSLVTTFTLFSNTESWLRTKANEIDFAKRQMKFLGLSEAQVEEYIEEMIAPPPSPEELRLAYLAVDRFARYGHAPGTIENYLRFGDVLPTATGRRGWSFGDRSLAAAILKGMRKCYKSGTANEIPLTAAVSFWLFRGFLKKFGNHEVARLFWLCSNVMRIGLFRSTELLYNGKEGRMLTLKDLEIADRSIFEIARDFANMGDALMDLMTNLEKIPYWSIFLEYAKTDQEGKGTKVFVTPGSKMVPLLHTLLSILAKRARKHADVDEVLVPSDPLFASSIETCMNYDRFSKLWKLLTQEFNSEFCKFSIYSHRKGGATGLLESGYSLPQTRVVARWKQGVCDHYFRMSPLLIVKIQEEVMRGVSGVAGMDYGSTSKKFEELDGPSQSKGKKLWALTGWNDVSQEGADNEGAWVDQGFVLCVENNYY